MKLGDLEVLVVGNPPPGWGGRYFLFVRLETARAHPYEGTGLHLEMQEAPCDCANGNAFPGGAPATGD